MDTNTEPKPSRFTCSRDSDGCDETWDIRCSDGTHLTCIHFWERADDTEAEAKRIVDALNAFTGDVAKEGVWETARS